MAAKTLILINSWKTTASGILAIVVALGGAAGKLLDGNVTTNPDWNAVAVAVMAGIGLIFARDNDKTSAHVGVE